jgi:hypothetical protein
MQTFKVLEIFPGTTVTHALFLHFENKDIESKDQVLSNLILRYDVFLSNFHPKWKPFWQTKPLPEYV